MNILSKGTDQEYLLTEQYQDANNLNARAQLHLQFNTNPYKWTRWLFDQFDLPDQARILEIGCGPGFLWQDNLDRIPTEWKITLSDFSPGMTTQAQKNLTKISSQLTFENFDAQTIPLGEAQFEAVIANHMIYHIPDKTLAYAEFNRVLKPGGHFYAATNGAAHLQEIRDLLTTVCPDDPSIAKHVMSDPFTLEIGINELVNWFSNVRLYLYDSHLRVTEIEPLVAYIHSARSLTEGQTEHLSQLIKTEIAAKGFYHITKSTGLFVAQQRLET